MPLAAAAPILDYGEGPLAGVYLLRIQVARALSVRFGRYAGGKPIAVPPGTLVYIGSARTHRGALAHRLLRHLTRTAARPPHRLRGALHRHFASEAALPEPSTKRLHWHIDYLLNELDAEVVQVVLWRTIHPVEAVLAAELAAQPAIAPLAPGLGASDHRGQTHLLMYAGSDAAWSTLLAYLKRLLSFCSCDCEGHAPHGSSF